MNLFRKTSEQLYTLLGEEKNKLKEAGFLLIKFVGVSDKQYIYEKAKEEYNLAKARINRIEKELKCK